MVMIARHENACFMKNRTGTRRTFGSIGPGADANDFGRNRKNTSVLLARAAPSTTPRRRDRAPGLKSSRQASKPVRAPRPQRRSRAACSAPRAQPRSISVFRTTLASAPPNSKPARLLPRHCLETGCSGWNLRRGSRDAAGAIASTRCSSHSRRGKSSGPDGALHSGTAFRQRAAQRKIGTGIEQARAGRIDLRAANAATRVLFYLGRSPDSFPRPRHARAI